MLLVHFPAWTLTQTFPQAPPILLLASGCWKLLYKTDTLLSLLCYARSKLLYFLMLVFWASWSMRTDPGCRCLPPLPFLGVRLIGFCTFAWKYHCCRLHPRLLRPLKETHRPEPLSLSQRIFWCPCLKKTRVCVSCQSSCNYTCSCFLTHIRLQVNGNTCLL